MTIAIQICYIIKCDGCKKNPEGEDFIPHFEIQSDALDWMRDNEWDYYRDQVWCPDCEPPLCMCDHEFGGHGRRGDEPCEEMTDEHFDRECVCEGYTPTGK